MSLSKSSPIVIVGAGVFGLSSAIHLAERGYTNVKIVDRQPYHESHYSYDKGCDGASADMNKIMRVSYGKQMEYQTMAIDALQLFKGWNEEIKTGNTLPPGFKTSDKIFCNNGSLTVNDQAELTAFDLATIANMKKAGYPGTQIDLHDSQQVKKAVQNGFEFAVNPFRRRQNENFGLLDMTGGMVYADRACRFALHKAEKLGVKAVFGKEIGTFDRFVRDTDSDTVLGIKTEDGTFHKAELTIMACGGWTPSLVPELDGLCETTCGSVSIFQLPKGNKELWDRFAPENFPTWKYKIRDGAAGGLYGFARDASGKIKIGYRGTKYTNPQTQPDGNVRSVPITRWTKESTRQLPLQAADVIRGFVERFIPELMTYHVKNRLCWYTDSFDNHFVVDNVPNSPGLMVATGGSGHGFKFLPNLGKYVVDKIEGKFTENDVVHQWRWRKRAAGQDAFNVIMEGSGSERALQKQRLTGDDRLVTSQSRI